MSKVMGKVVVEIKTFPGTEKVEVEMRMGENVIPFSGNLDGLRSLIATESAPFSSFLGEEERKTLTRAFQTALEKAESDLSKPGDS